MFLSLNARSDAATLILVAVLMLCIWLTPSALMAGAPNDSGKRWVFVCGSLQSKWVALDAEQTPEGDAQTHEECPLCGLFKLYDATPKSDVAFDSVTLRDMGRTSYAPEIAHVKRLAHDASPRAPPFCA
jgi:hypothetical protein